MEPFYTPKEIAKTWKLSEDKVRRVFQDEPGVLVLESRSYSGRRYRTLRIPESVLQRVTRRLSNGA